MGEIGEMMRDARTATGAMYMVGSLIAILASALAIKHSVHAFEHHHKDPTAMLVSLFVGVSFALKMPYIYDKSLTRGVIALLTVGWLTSALIYMLTLFRHHPSMPPYAAHQGEHVHAPLLYEQKKVVATAADATVPMHDGSSDTLQGWD